MKSTCILLKILDGDFSWPTYWGIGAFCRVTEKIFVMKIIIRNTLVINKCITQNIKLE